MLKLTAKEVRLLEKEFELVLPHGYRRLLLSPPKLLAALVEASKRIDDPEQTPFFLEYSILADVNRRMRNPNAKGYCCFGPDDDPLPWPERYLIIGSDVGGNYYCIAPTSGRSSVYLWEQGDSALNRITKDISGYVRRSFRDWGNGAALDCEDD